MTRALGFTNDVTTCDHCGKTYLKGTCAVEENEQIVHYGSVCIAKAFGKEQGKTLKDCTGYVNILKHAKDRSALALQWLGWGTKDGWIVDGIGERVIEAV